MELIKYRGNTNFETHNKRETHDHYNTYSAFDSLLPPYRTIPHMVKGSLRRTWHNSKVSQSYSIVNHLSQFPSIVLAFKF